MFVNRVSKLSLVEKYHRNTQAELFVLYSRRSVGKTELLSHFCKGTRAIFFVADQVSESGLRDNFSGVINAALFGPGHVSAVFATLDDLFTTLACQAPSERLVVVLCEFP